MKLNMVVVPPSMQPSEVVGEIHRNRRKLVQYLTVITYTYETTDTL